MFNKIQANQKNVKIKNKYPKRIRSVYFIIQFTSIYNILNNYYIIQI